MGNSPTRPQIRKEHMKNLLTSDIVRRAAKTFIQAFVAVLVVGYVNVKDVESAKALAVAAVAAGVSAVWNLVKQTA